MRHDTFWLTASDATSLYVHHWYGQPRPKAVVMIAHGMAEHGARYARLAEALVTAGFEVYAHDQRGHGHTVHHGVLGHFADQDGWCKVVDDLASLNHHIRQQHPQAPIFLLGHSIGSYIAQAYLMQHSCSLQGAILSGSSYQSMALYRLASLVARFERYRQGPTGRSSLLHWLTFGAFNKAFKPTRTAFDWLSRDPLEVDHYLADPLCGFRCTNQLWLDLFSGLQQITPLKQLAQIDTAMPLLVIGGGADPLSTGQRLQRLANALRQAGNHSVQLRIYRDARHELFHESNRDEVTTQLIHWLEEALVHSRHCPAP
ncbi:MAG: lysophospholipase [Pseudomonas sp.]